MFRLGLFFCCFVILSVPVNAAEEISLVTGPKTGTYYAIGKDIAFTAARAGIDIEAKASEGSVDNIKRINGKEKATLGIVQSDVLGFLSRSKNPDSMRMGANLRMVFPLYHEEVHVLARRSIRNFEELSGKEVAIGEDGSGNMLTAINLFSMMGVKPREIKKIPPEQGVVEVLKGDLDAVVFVSGKPVRLFKNLEDLSLPENRQYAPMMEQLHFLPLDAPKMLEEYRPAAITPQDYNFVKSSVPTVASQAILIAYESDGNKQRCALLATLAKTLRENLPQLREKGHPKWKEVDFDADSGVWKKDACVWPQLSGEDRPLGEDLIGVIEEKR